MKEKLLSEEDKYAREGLPFDEMFEKTKETRIEIKQLSQQIRKQQNPTMQFGKKWKGDLMTLDKFIEFSKNHHFKDNDGEGFYATEKGVSDIPIYPSDILDNVYRADFSHVMWFAK